MTYWGLAFALGPNYNKAWQLFDQADLRVTTERTYDVSDATGGVYLPSHHIEVVDALFFSPFARFDEKWEAGYCAVNI